MGIVESIQTTRKRGIKDEKILQEIIKQNPSKKESLKQALRRGASPTWILEEIIKQNQPGKKPQEEKQVAKEKIEEARKRLKSLKIQSITPVPPLKKPLKKEETPSSSLSFRRTLLSKETPLEKKPPQKEIKKPQKKPTPPFIRPLPKKPTLREKLWARVIVFCLILVLLAGVASFWYWYFQVRPEPYIGCTQDKDCPEGFICEPGGVCKEASPIQQCSSNKDCKEDFVCSDGICIKGPEEVAFSPSLFPVDGERILKVANLEEIKDLLSQTIQEYKKTGEFERIIFKNTTEDKFLGVKEFFDAFQIRVPDNIYPTFENEFTLFIYSQPQGNRLGFATEIKDKTGLESILRAQESTMKDDFKPFFTLMIEDKPPVVSYFRNANQLPGYTNHNFRYQTLSRNDAGICYMISDNYFVFTSSFESTEQVIEKLGVPGPTVELTKDLSFGDREYEVEVLQTWLKQDASVYPQGLVTGYYGPLTRQAVTNFQEKHASEILAPQGRIKGTGEVKQYTRVKLNELYGESGAIPSRPEITTDLRYGDHGDEVRLLQKWLAENATVYPERIISGWFGPLTRAAVTRFQEKYKSEILDPQGLTEGTGIVDASTRKKLNELYGR